MYRPLICNKLFFQNKLLHYRLFSSNNLKNKQFCQLIDKYESLNIKNDIINNKLKEQIKEINNKTSKELKIKYFFINSTYNFSKFILFTPILSIGSIFIGASLIYYNPYSFLMIPPILYFSYKNAEKNEFKFIRFVEKHNSILINKYKKDFINILPEDIKNNILDKIILNEKYKELIILGKIIFFSSILYLDYQIYKMIIY